MTSTFSPTQFMCVMSADLRSSIHAGQFSDAQHQEIVNRLEALKAAGLITDCFVSWVGVAGKLNPVVRVWRKPEISEFRLREHISSLLGEVINTGNLTIVDGETIVDGSSIRGSDHDAHPPSS